MWLVGWFGDSDGWDWGWSCGRGGWLLKRMGRISRLVGWMGWMTWINNTLALWEDGGIGHVFGVCGDCLLCDRIHPGWWMYGIFPTAWTIGEKIRYLLACWLTTLGSLAMDTLHHDEYWLQEQTTKLRCSLLLSRLPTAKTTTEVFKHFFFSLLSNSLFGVLVGMIRQCSWAGGILVGYVTSFESSRLSYFVTTGQISLLTLS